MVRERGATTPGGKLYPGSICRRLRDDLQEPPRRQTGNGGAGETACAVWAHTASRQDASHRLPSRAKRWHASRPPRTAVRLPRLHPHLGEIAERQERGATDDGQEPACPLAATRKRLVSEKPPPADTVAA